MRLQSKKTLLAGLAVLSLIVYFAHAAVLTAAGSYLVDARDPVQADAVFVLAGDNTGGRIIKAAELVREGYAPLVVVSGPQGFYGAYECDLAIDFAVRQGFPEQYFAHFENQANSTEEEAAAAAVEIRRRGIQRLLLVTSNYHTRRAWKQFRRHLPEVKLTMVAAPDINFTPDTWWKSRPAQKIFLLEWTKTVATWFGI